jgi:ribulose-phosphate 3-epimerase
MIQATGKQILIEVDGGVDLQNSDKLVQAGVDILVAGNTIFSSSNPVEIIAKLAEAK